MTVLRCGPGGPIFSTPPRPRAGTRIVVAREEKAQAVAITPAPSPPNTDLGPISDKPGSGVPPKPLSTTKAPGPAGEQAEK